MIKAVRSYRIRLFEIFLLGISPFILVDLYQLTEVRQHTFEQSIQNAKTLIQSLHKHHLVLLETVERELDILSHSPTLKSNDYKTCDQTLETILSRTHFYINIALADPEGNLLCTAKKGMSHISKIAQPAFEKALHEQTFSVGAGAISDNHGLPIIPFAYPIKNHETLKNPILMAGVSLRWLNTKSYDTYLIPGMQVLVLSGQQNVIGTIPSKEEWLGNKLPSDVALPSDSGDSVLDTSEAVWIFGESVHNMRIIVRISKQDLYETSERLLTQSLLSIFLMFGVALLMSLWASDKLVIKEVNRLMKIMLQQTRNASVNELLKNIAHHWRNPLNIISIKAENIKEDIEFDTCDRADIVKNLNIITDITFNMASTVNYFGDFFDKPGETGKFEIKESLQITSTLLKPHMEAENVNLTTQCEPEDCSLSGKQNEMVQIFFHLMNNSIDSMVKHNKTERWIKVHAHTEQNQLIIIVEDSGGGIDPEIFPKIFEPYTTTKFPSSGTGISLYMVKASLENHFRGNIEVANTEEGCKFTLKLPIL